jgi:NTE family protein
MPGLEADRPGGRDAAPHLRSALPTVDDALLARLADTVEWRTLRRDDVLFRQGDATDAMYVVADGSLRASIAQGQGGDLVVGRIGVGEPVGEIQILSGGARTATVSAETDTTLVRVPRSAVEALAREAPDAMRRLAAGVRRRIHRNQLAAILPTLLGPLDDDVLGELDATVEWVTVPRGEILFRQGESGTSVYILVSGRLRAVVRDARGRERAVGEIQRGETVGEMALFTGEPRTATVVALRDTELVRLDGATFDALIARCPQALMSLTRLTISRLRNVDAARPVVQEVTTIALVPAGGAPATDFARRLAAALAQFGATLHVTAADVDRRLGTPGLANVPPDDPQAARIAVWLDEQETTHRFVLLESAAGASPWSRRCVHHADHVLIVGVASEDPTPGPAERDLLPDDAGGGAAHRLVLLHATGDRPPTGTRRWLASRRVAWHQHVRLDREGDVARLARRLAGRAIGVVLSGGGARGFAHVGVLEALEEAGVPIDLVGGTSMGAFIGGEFALGWDPPTMVRQNREMFARWGFDLTLPILSILGGHRSNTRLKRAIGDVQIEDLWIPYFCISSNLTRAEMVVHRDGPLRLGLRASAGLPGILPPVVVDQELLIDGGFLRNLPADVMRELVGDGTVIAVDVSAEHDLAQKHHYGDAISGWRILWSRLNPFGTRLATPSIAAVLYRAGEIASVAMQREALAQVSDLYIRVPVERFGMLDFRRDREIIATGYKAATRRIAEWMADTGRVAPTSEPMRQQRQDFRDAMVEDASA